MSPTPTPRRGRRSPRRPELDGLLLRAPAGQAGARPASRGPADPIHVSGCDYLGLSRDPVVREAWLRASTTGPLQTGASRATTGDHPLYRRAEDSIADFLGEADAVFTATGYLASLAVAQGLAAEATHVIVDEGAHRCVRDGARLSGLPVIPFATGNPEALRSALRRLPRSARPLVATDGVHGLRGGMAPLDALLAVLPASGWLWVDDAHGIGSAGATGRGSAEVFGLRDARLVRSLTGSKALGVAGGAVVGAAPVIDQVRRRAGAYLASSAPPLAVAAAFAAAVDRVHRRPGLVRRLQGLAARFSAALPSRPEILTDPRTPVTAIHPVDAAQARNLDESLRAAGFVSPWIRYPGGPGDGFFRIALRATLSASQVDRLARAIRDGL